MGERNQANPMYNKSEYEGYLDDRKALLRNIKRVSGKDLSGRYPVLPTERSEYDRQKQIEALEAAFSQLAQSFSR